DWGRAWGAVVAFAFAADGSTPLFFRGDPEASVIVPADEAAIRTAGLDVVEGRLPKAAGEAAISWGSTDGPRAEIGDQVVVRMVRKDANVGDLLGGGPPPPEALLPDLRLTVVGVVRTPNDLDGTDDSLVVAPSYHEIYPSKALGCDLGLFQLHNGLNDVVPFEAGLSKIESQ